MITIVRTRKLRALEQQIVRLRDCNRALEQALIAVAKYCMRHHGGSR